MLKQVLLLAVALVALAAAAKDGYCEQGGTFTPALSGIYRVGNVKVPGKEGQPQFCMGFTVGGKQYTFSCEYKRGQRKVGDVRAYYTKTGETTAKLQVFGTVYGGKVKTAESTHWNSQDSHSGEWLLDYTFYFTRTPEVDGFDSGNGQVLYEDEADGSGTLTNAKSGIVLEIDPKIRAVNGEQFSHAIGYNHHGNDPAEMQVWGWVKIDGRRYNRGKGFRDFLFTMNECVEYCAPGDKWFPQVSGRYQFGTQWNWGGLLTIDADASTSKLEGLRITGSTSGTPWGSCSDGINMAGWDTEVQQVIFDSIPTASGFQFGDTCYEDYVGAQRNLGPHNRGPGSHMEYRSGNPWMAGAGFFPFHLMKIEQNGNPNRWAWAYATIGNCYPEGTEGQCAPQKVTPLKSVFDTTIDAELEDGQLTLTVDTPWEDRADPHNYVKDTTITFLPGPSDPTARKCDMYSQSTFDDNTAYEGNIDDHWTTISPVQEEGNYYCREVYTGIFSIAEIEECAYKVYCTDGENGPQVTPDNPTCDETLCDADNCYKVYEFEFSVDRTYHVEAHTLDIKSERLAGDEHRIIIVIPWIQKAEVTFDIAGPIDVQWAAVIPLLKYNLDDLRTPEGTLVESAGSWSFKVKTGLRMPFMLVEGENGGKLVRQNPGAPLEVDYEISDHEDGCVYTDGLTVQDQVCTQTIDVTFDNCDDLVDRYTYKFSELYYTCKEVVDDMGVESQLYWPEFCLQDPPTKEADLIVDIQGTQSCEDIRREVVVGTPTLETYEQAWDSPIKTYLFGDDLVNLRFSVQAPAGYVKTDTDPEYCYGFPAMDGLELTKLDAGQKFKGANDEDVVYNDFDVNKCTRFTGATAGCDQPCVYCCTIDPADITGLDINPNDAVTWWSVAGEWKLLWSGFQPTTTKRTISAPTSQQTKEEATMKFLLNGSNNTSGFDAVKPLFFLAVVLALALLF